MKDKANCNVRYYRKLPVEQIFQWHRLYLVHHQMLLQESLHITSQRLLKDALEPFVSAKKHICAFSWTLIPHHYLCEQQYTETIYDSTSRAILALLFNVDWRTWWKRIGSLIGNFDNHYVLCGHDNHSKHIWLLWNCYKLEEVPWLHNHCT